jgi:site-specific DNA-methyltransferase (adenine-specific)
MVALSDDGPDYVVYGDNIEILPELPDSFFQLIYIDPPFNTKKARHHQSVKTTQAADGDRVGFGGRRYRTVWSKSNGYMDRFDDYLSFLAPRLEQARRLLREDGSLYLHVDYRESHYCKLLLDEIFGRKCFINEIIWAYDYGGRSRRRWPAKHDTILFYAREPKSYFFDQDAVDRIPYMAPSLVTPQKAARGKTPTDVWWHTIVPTSGREKTGYCTQKPEGVVRRILLASSQPGCWVLDFFAGSGTAGAVARQLGRRFLLVDNNPDAIAVIKRRLGTDRTSYVDVKDRPLAWTLFEEVPPRRPAVGRDASELAEDDPQAGELS